MSEVVTITYVNESDENKSDFLVFSTPVMRSVNVEQQAWQVIKHVSPGGSHVFQYTVASQLRVAWDDGASVSNVVDAMPGQGFQFTTVGEDYQLVGDSDVHVQPMQIGLLNNVPEAVTAQLLKNGRVWAADPGVTRGSLAIFQFEPRIYFGFGHQPVKTPALSYAVMSSAWTELSLLGLESLTIAATGTRSSGYQFVIRDVVQP